MLSKWLGRRDDPREISNADAAEAYKTNGAVFVDVREADEWAAGHMPGAVHIPLGDLARRVRELPKDREIITVCRSGGRYPQRGEHAGREVDGGRDARMDEAGASGRIGPGVAGIRYPEKAGGVSSCDTASPW